MKNSERYTYIQNHLCMKKLASYLQIKKACEHALITPYLHILI